MIHLLHLCQQHEGHMACNVTNIQVARPGNWQLPWRPLGETVTWILVVRQHTMSHTIWRYVGDSMGAAGVAD